MHLGIAMSDAIVGLIVFLLALAILFFIFACKSWRFLFSNRSEKIDDLEKPLISDDLNLVQGQERASVGIEENFPLARTYGRVPKQKCLSLDARVSHGPLDDLAVGHTHKHTVVATWSVDDHVRQEDSNLDNDYRYQVSLPKDAADQRSSLTVEVISGPSSGLRYSLGSTNTSKLTLGRVPPSDIVVKDSEVSGKHAQINWNPNKSKWELVDMGSLNGTLLNSRAVNLSDTGHRHWSEPIELSSGDIITLGTTSKLLVQITQLGEDQFPFGVGVASDPMALRRGGKKLPMEDVCYYQWPLPGAEQFGLFGIFDGHGGAGAAKEASRMLPKVVANILSIAERRERVLSLCDASEVLRDAFCQTEAAMNHQYEGCTATILLVWAYLHEEFFAQCANVGDSACVISVGEKQIVMTEDHRITSHSERNRMMKTGGGPLKDGETRLCGLNIARMLGDKFLKEQDVRFSSVPYVSQVVHIPRMSNSFALLASDGLWDVLSMKKAMQLVLQTRERYGVRKENTAESIANFVLSEARTLRTKDNTTIIFLDFDTCRTASSIIVVSDELPNEDKDLNIVSSASKTE